MFFQDVIEFINNICKTFPKLDVFHYSGKSIIPSRNVLRDYEDELDDFEPKEMFHNLTDFHVEFATRIPFCCHGMHESQDVFKNFADHFTKYLDKKCPKISEERIKKEWDEPGQEVCLHGIEHILGFHFCVK